MSIGGQQHGEKERMLGGKTILVTGGTGSFGQRFCERVLDAYPDIKKLIVFSRDELKQYQMANKSVFEGHPKLRFFLGDVRDRDRLKRAFEEVDVVIHAAALKQVPAAEYNPFEFIKTNVLGAQNVVEACFDTNVQKLVALSTDKASSPINLYGASKLCSDKLFIAANEIKGSRDFKSSIVRYGNVMGSRGSVIPFFLKLRETGTLPITDERMTRFNISLDDGVDMVLWSLTNAIGGEIFVPKIPSYNIMNLANAIGPDCKKIVVGIRPGEKLHEEMICAADAPRTVEMHNYYAILPETERFSIDWYCGKLGAEIVNDGFCYASDTNPDFLSEDQLRELAVSLEDQDS